MDRGFLTGAEWQRGRGEGKIMHIILKQLTDEGEESAGRVELREGKLLCTDCSPGTEEDLAKVKRILTPNGEVTPKDGVRFLEALVYHYHGSYFWAELVK